MRLLSVSRQRATTQNSRAAVLSRQLDQQLDQNAAGVTYRFEQEYEWLGFTDSAASVRDSERSRRDKSLRLDMFAYDMNEPDMIEVLRPHTTLAPGIRPKLHTSTENGHAFRRSGVNTTDAETANSPELTRPRPTSVELAVED